MPVSTHRHQISATLPDDLRAALEELAHAERRTVSFMAALLIEEGLEARAKAGERDRVVVKARPPLVPVRGVRRRRTNITMPNEVYARLRDFAWSERRSQSEAMATLIHERIELRAVARRIA